MNLQRICFFTVISVFVLVACTPRNPPPPPGMTCESLNTLLLGGRITVTVPPGNSFQPPTMDIGAHPFTYASGVLTSNGFAMIENGGRAGGVGNEIKVNNILISISIGFGKTLQKVRFSFGEYGGNLNVSINNKLVNFSNFADIAGTTINGVTVTLISGGGGNDKGQIEFTGNMIDQASGFGQFSVGGQELYIDDICFVP